MKTVYDGAIKNIDEALSDIKKEKSVAVNELVKKEYELLKRKKTLQQRKAEAEKSAKAEYKNTKLYATFTFEDGSEFRNYEPRTIYQGGIDFYSFLRMIEVKGLPKDYSIL